MPSRIFILCLLFLASCPRHTPIKNYQIAANIYFRLAHKGQTRLNVEYKQIFISMQESYVKSLDRKYSFSVSEKELQNLYTKIKQVTLKSKNMTDKETIFEMANAQDFIKYKDSIWNLASYVAVIEDFIDKKIALPFRLPIRPPQNFSIEIEEREDLFSEYGKYTRIVEGEAHLSILDKQQKQLHTFSMDKNELQQVLDILRKQRFMWLPDSEEYADSKIVVTWGRNRLEKNVVLSEINLFIEKTKNLKEFPDIEKIPDNLQLEILYRTEQTRKEIFLSNTTGYLYVLDEQGNRVQYQLTVTPRVMKRLLAKIKKNQEFSEEANMVISWENSRIEKDISLNAFTAMEEEIYDILKKESKK